MKNIVVFVVFILCLVFVQFVNGQSVDDIIDQYITARGGKDKIAAITSVHFEGMRQMNGNEVDLKITKVDGKLSRTEFSVGGNNGYVIVTPDKGWTYIPMMSDNVNEIPEARLKSMQDQMDIAGPLFNYAAKGYKATLQGKDTIGGHEAWKIQLSNDAGKNMTFYIDTKSNLLIQSKQMSEGGGRNNSGPTEIVTDYSDYKDIDGVMFPQTINIEGSGMGAGSMTFDKIEVNQPVDEKLYKPSN